MQIAAMTSVLYSKRNSAEKIPVIESVRRLKAAGFAHIDLNMSGMARNEQEFCGEDWKWQTDRLRNEAEKLGVTFVQSHAPYYAAGHGMEREEYERYFERMLLRSVEISHMLGVHASVVHPAEGVNCAPEDKAAHLARTRKIHLSFMEKAKKLGIAPAYENMPDLAGTNRFCKGAVDLLMLCDAFRDYGAGVCWDFGHGNLSFADQCLEIAKLKGRILCVHTHDNKGKNDDHLMPFMGSIPWERVLPALKGTGFKNDLVLEVSQNAKMPDDLKDESTLLMAHASRLLLRMFES